MKIYCNDCGEELSMSDDSTSDEISVIPCKDCLDEVYEDVLDKVRDGRIILDE